MGLLDFISLKGMWLEIRVAAQERLAERIVLVPSRQTAMNEVNQTAS
jgi:hypothetical protein